jgi:hypothetical protein
MDTRVVPPRHLVQLGQLEENFHNEAGQFMHIMTNGGGLRNMQLSECLSHLQYIYMQIAAHLDAARDVNGQVTIETGRRALAVARSLVQHDQEETIEST